MPAYVAFGANLGEPRATYQAVETRLSRLPCIQSVRSSPLYRTSPVGGPSGQADYINGAFEVQTSATPQALHQHLLQIQREFGRPEQDHWQPRTLDLDLVLFDSHVVDTPDLVVPHPRAHHRWFVLRPLVDLAPHAKHPAVRRTALELLELLQTTDPTIYIVGTMDATDQNRLREWIAQRWTSPPQPHCSSPLRPRPLSSPRSPLRQGGTTTDGRASDAARTTTVLRCPVSSRDVDFFHLAGTVVAADFPDAAAQVNLNGSSIWFVVVEAVEPRSRPASRPCWPAVDLQSDSLDGSVRKLDYFLESRRPGQPVEMKQE